MLSTGAQAATVLCWINQVSLDIHLVCYVLICSVGCFDRQNSLVLFRFAEWCCWLCTFAVFVTVMLLMLTWWRLWCSVVWWDDYCPAFLIANCQILAQKYRDHQVHACTINDNVTLFIHVSHLFLYSTLHDAWSADSTWIVMYLRRCVPSFRYSTCDTQHKWLG